ncbi:small glutamine-rich tetratricopeptide repeat-containing protein alpha-like [Pollicipes pollicipes]|uniref:small glutamine-rich tetratricopeptide repeat-containing protein alpha-like n=1 Tax=Pollicipes pollicipes TaxID=41117 RepID=UPI001884E319|nr:small glutamine-rich tetratricopeptide repeat-containing protein alpha-like [Pollicipes pollicipes]
MSDAKKIVFSIIQFLNAQLQDGGLSQDSQESLEVAVQCLETSFGVTATDTHLAVEKPLPQIFTDGLQLKAQAAATASAPPPPPPPPPPRAPEATPEQKEKAEALKNDGNIAVREERLHEAVDKYSQAIELDGNNAAYFSNRAAAYTKLGNYTAAVEDAQRALQIDPAYTKAYSRLALAYAGLNRFEEAQTQIKRALELDPGNESYQNNLQVIETRMAEAAQAGGGGATGLPGLGGFGQFANMGGLNLEAMLNNPAMMNVAAQMMQDPNMQQMMNGLMSGAGAPGAGAGGGGFEALLQAGQRLAEQVRTTNPDLIEQLRQQMGGPGGPGGAGGPGGPPPPPPSGDR